jgi:hypothetical protein
MWINTFFKFLTSTPTRRRPIRRRPLASRLRLEQLEDRTLPSNFTAATVSDLIADINAANQQGGSNTIALVAPTTSPYALSAVDNTTDGATGLPVIAANDNLSIIGNGDTIERSTAAGTPAFRLLDVASGAGLTLENLTLQGGLAQGSGSAASGGAIYSQGSLTLNGVIVQRNAAVGVPVYTVGVGAPAGDGLGGGLCVAGGSFTMTSSILSANKALGGDGEPGMDYIPYGSNGGNGGNGLGGAVYVAAGTVIMTSDTWSANTAQGGRGGDGGGGYTDDYNWTTYGGNGGDGGSGRGGAVYVVDGTVNVNSDSLSANTAQGGRGGDGGVGYNTGFYSPPYGGNGGNGGNGESGLGGGLYVAGGTVTLTSATVSSNGAWAGAGGLGGGGDITIGLNGRPGLGQGGGLFIAPVAAVGLDPFTVQHVLNNTASTSYPDIFGSYSLAPGFAVTGFPSTTTAGAAGAFTVTANNANGTTATNYTGTVHFTSSDPLAALPADYTFIAIDQGVHTFSARLKTAGTQSITAAETTPGSLIGTEAGITVNPAAASTFTITGFPSPTTAGVARNFTITALDPYGNKATGYTGMVHFSSSDAQAVLPSNSTLTNGTGQFSAMLNTAGTQSLTATDTTNASLTGTQGGITVYAAVKTLAVAGFPSAITAGVAGSFTVTAKDGNGNVATWYTDTVVFSSSDGQAVLPTTYTFTAADKGVHTFSAILKTAGMQSITVKDTAAVALSGSEGGITVRPAAASKFLISAPASVQHGVRFSLTITVEDAYGNVVTGYTGTIHFTSTDTTATLPANYTFTAADKGVHTFTGLVLRKKGTQKITITDTLNSSLTGSVIENVL